MTSVPYLLVLSFGFSHFRWLTTQPNLLLVKLAWLSKGN